MVGCKLVFSGRWMWRRKVIMNATKAARRRMSRMVVVAMNVVSGIDEARRVRVLI